MTVLAHSFLVVRAREVIDMFLFSEGGCIYV